MAKNLSVRLVAGALLAPAAGIVAVAKSFDGLTYLAGLGAWTGSARILPGALPIRAFRGGVGAADRSSEELLNSLEKNLAPAYFANLVDGHGLRGSGLEGNSFSGPA